jgi:hypothetical protein
VEYSPLEGMRKKLERAYEQVRSLNDDFNRFVRDQEGPIGDYEPKWSDTFVVRAAHEPIPLSWAVLIGEILHDFRSLLDHLAWQLASFKGKPPDYTAFPVFLEQDDFTSRSGRSGIKIMDGIGTRGRAFITRHQPYKRRHKLWLDTSDDATAESHPLWLLHELNRVEKHRLLQVSALSIEIGTIRIIEESTGQTLKSLVIFQGQGMDPDTELGSWTLPGQPKVKVEGHATPGITFMQTDPEAAQGRNVGRTFYEIGRYVAEVFNEAEQRFPLLKRPIPP